MKCSAGYPIASGFLVLAFSGILVGQTPVPGHADRALPATIVADSPAQREAASGNKPHGSDFVIGNDDILAINVWKEPDLCRSIPVRSDGKISLPLVGEVLAAGRTPLQLEQDIAGKLQNFITAPEVTVMVEKINSENFNIVGQVTKPGSYALALAPTVMDAIATAGGFRDFAKQRGVYVLRQNPGGGETRIAFNYKDFIKGKNPGQNVRLQPRDTVVVP
jgi:polysaccharide export outer membrane protein